MPKPKRPHKTFHISVPENDLETVEWLAAQYNQSSSVRELIRYAARQFGMVDLFIGAPAQRDTKKRGRIAMPEGYAPFSPFAGTVLTRTQPQDVGSGNMGMTEVSDIDEDKPIQTVVPDKNEPSFDEEKSNYAPASSREEQTSKSNNENKAGSRPAQTKKKTGRGGAISMDPSLLSGGKNKPASSNKEIKQVGRGGQGGSGPGAKKKSAVDDLLDLMDM